METKTKKEEREIKKNLHFAGLYPGRKKRRHSRRERDGKSRCACDAVLLLLLLQIVVVGFWVNTKLL